MAQKRAYFDAGLPVLTNENSSASLGFLGALGFVGLLAGLLFLRLERKDEFSGPISRNSI